MRALASLVMLCETLNSVSHSFKPCDLSLVFSFPVLVPLAESSDKMPNDQGK